MSETQTITTPDVTIKSVATFAERARSIGTLLFAVGAGIVSCTLLWVKVNTMASDIDELRKEMHLQIEHVDDENTKRFARSTEWNNARAAQQKELDERMRAVEVEQAYQKGLRDGKK